MILTPLDIRQKTFEKKFRGYDQLEVEAFLKILSTEWENIVEEKKILEIKLDTEKTELKRLQAIEHTLFQTLQTAEETGKTIVQQANREAELTLKEKKNEANQFLNETKLKASRLIENAEISAKAVVKKTTTHLNDLHKELLNISTEYNKILNDLENTIGGVQKSIDENKKKLESKNIESVLENSRDLLNNIVSQIDYLPIKTDEKIEVDVSVETDEKQISNDSSLKTEDLSVKNEANLDAYEEPNLAFEFNKDNENEQNEEKSEHIHQVEWKGKEVEPQRSTVTAEEESQPEKKEEYQDEKETDEVSFFDKV